MRRLKQSATLSCGGRGARGGLSSNDGCGMVPFVRPRSRGVFRVLALSVLLYGWIGSTGAAPDKTVPVPCGGGAITEEIVLTASNAGETRTILVKVSDPATCCFEEINATVSGLTVISPNPYAKLTDKTEVTYVVKVVQQNKEGSLRLSGKLGPVHQAGTPGKGSAGQGQGQLRDFTVDVFLRIAKLVFKQPVNGTDLVLAPGQVVDLQAAVEIGNSTVAKSGTLTWSPAPTSLGALTLQTGPLLNGKMTTTFTTSGSLSTGTGTITVEGSALVSQLNVTLPNLAQNLNVVVSPVHLQQVSFTGTGPDIVPDDESVKYDAPHWQDKTTPPDGSAEENGDRKYPVLYISDSLMSTTVKVHAANADIFQGKTVKIRGTGPAGYTFPATAATVDGASASASIPCAKAFLKAVYYFESFDIAWEVSLDGGQSWFAVGTSRNQLYVTLGSPPEGMKCYHTLVHIGCASAAGKTTANEVFNAIWAKFETRDVRRVKNPAVPMTYWGDPDLKKTEARKGVKALLKDGDGRCGAWAPFFDRVLKAQEVPNTAPSGVIPLIAPLAYQGEYILVKNVDLAKSPVDLSVAGIPGQGVATPQAKLFNGHAFLLFADQIFDPSYGTRFPALLDWQVNSLDLIRFRTVNGDLFDVRGDVLRTALWVQLAGFIEEE